MMTQAIEIPRVPRCEAPASWLSRLCAKLFGPRASSRAVRLHDLSTHVLRDIGMLDGPRANHLLRDDRLFRR
jgi:hypothetical protein